MDKYTLENMKEEIKNVGGNKNSKPLITIVVDFDGTVVEHEYPRTGKENGNCSEILKRWIDESDIYMLILGGRYGFIETKSGKSYTHLEYEYALSIKKPLFVIVIKDQALNQKTVAQVENQNPENLRKKY